MQPMSYELRLKKLRGSGGFVMAQVSDDQQRKGNLGGPDLFLAPIGRLDVEKISKYYCNTCEKDYSGSPKIDFENPNEEVAQNLVLLERGQYRCTTCGSTIAEYREFQKMDQQAEVGLAKPIAPVEQPQQTYQAPQPTYQAPPVPEPTYQAPEPVYQAPEPAYQAPVQEIPPPTFAIESTPEFTSIIGMHVYDANVRRIGVATQVGVNSAFQVVLVITKANGQQEQIEWNKLKKVGEIILLDDQGQSSAAPACSKCGFGNKAGSKFCESCGNKL
jgi:sporulation protein YlmC with PRC-barrel domain